VKHQRDTHRWVALSNAAMQLPHLLCPLSLETWEEIVRNAVQSGLVAVRGVAKGDHTQQPIEKRITAGMSVDVLASTVHDGWPVLPLWREVKIDYRALVSQVENFLPTWKALTEQERSTLRAGYSRHMSKVEKRTEPVPKGERRPTKSAQLRENVIRPMFAESKARPGVELMWKTFRDNVRDKAEAWTNEAKTSFKRGFSDRQIDRTARALMEHFR
jgi:hypothetical protein